MAVLTIQLPPQQEQTKCNLRRWAELCADPELAKIEGRIETDRYGHIIMMPPAVPFHGGLQSEISYLLRTLMQSGRPFTEAPISTADGVKAADVAWASHERINELGNHSCFQKAPEICVEIISRSNTRAEIEEKAALCFDAGAKEVWTCSGAGVMTFLKSKAKTMNRSELCPNFPARVTI